MRLIDEQAAKSPTESFLDAGCGSGILSITASLLGYGPIETFDIDPIAVKVAKENLLANNISPQQIDPVTAALDEFNPINGTFNLVAANILASVLLENREKLASLVKPGGELLLAGILTAEFAEISEAFCQLGFAEADRQDENGWTGGRFFKQI